MSDHKRSLSFLFRVPSRGLFGLFSGPYIAIDNSFRVFIGQPGKMKEGKPQAVFRTINELAKDELSVQFENGDCVDVEWGGGSITATFNNVVINTLDATNEELVASLKIADVVARPKPASI